MIEENKRVRLKLYIPEAKLLVPVTSGLLCSHRPVVSYLSALSANQNVCDYAVQQPRSPLVLHTANTVIPIRSASFTRWAHRAKL